MSEMVRGCTVEIIVVFLLIPTLMIADYMFFFLFFFYFKHFVNVYEINYLVVIFKPSSPSTSNAKPV